MGLNIHDTNMFMIYAIYNIYCTVDYLANTKLVLTIILISRTNRYISMTKKR